MFMNLLTAGYRYTSGYGRGFYFDKTYLLALLGLALTLLAQAKVKNTFNQYSKIRSVTGLTGATAARTVLDSFGIYDVSIERVSGNLTDHYDPGNKVLRLSDSTYGSNSVAAICVAAHECGHARQHAVHYGPLVLRSTLVPAANFGSQAAWPVFLLGLFLSMPALTTAGIILFSLAVVFQLVTLPVEFDASARALKVLKEGGIMPEDELAGGKKVLTAAALTYVAALAASLLQLLRLIIIAGNRRDRR